MFSSNTNLIIRGVVCVSLDIYLLVDPAAEEVVYEAIAEPQEQSEQAQEGRCENSAQGPSDPIFEQQPEGKPRSITYYFNLWNIIYLLDYALGF